MCEGKKLSPFRRYILKIEIKEIKMFWISIFAAIWIVCSIFSYLLFKKIIKTEGSSWSNGDRLLGIFFGIFGPVTFISLLLIFLIVVIIYSKNSWLNKDAKW